MTIRVAINHKTEYLFDRPVALSPHVVRLRPAAHWRTPILAYSLKVEPESHFINWQQDPFGNYLARLVFPEKTREAVGRGGRDRRDDGDQPLRLLPGGVRREFPVRYDAAAAQGTGPLSGDRAEPAPLLGCLDGHRCRANRRAPSISWWR